MLNIEINTNNDITLLGGRWQEVGMCVARPVCVGGDSGKRIKYQSLISYSRKLTDNIYI